MPELLSTQELRAGYGSGIVLDGVSFTLEAGSVLAMLGRNGMGKTTTLMTLMGHTRRVAGSIRLEGNAIEGLAPHSRVRAGLGLVSQERDIFPSLTVEENLTVAAARGRWDLRSIYELLPRLAERKSNYGNQLSGGEQQMLAIGRALMGNPRVLLLDEPFEGLAPVIVDHLIATIRSLRESGMAMILVEQHIRHALALSDRTIILRQGTVAAEASSRELDEAAVARHMGLANQQ